MNCLVLKFICIFDLADYPITARVDSRTTARPGDTVKFAFDVEKIHIFDKETVSRLSPTNKKWGGEGCDASSLFSCIFGDFAI